MQAKFFTGSGTPETFVVGDPGDAYLDAAAGVLYYKATGRLATGWVASSLTAPNATLAAGAQEAIVPRSTDTSAPITQKTGTVMLTKSTAGAWTLAAPTSGDDDGKILTLIAGSAHAHTVITPSGKLNAGTTATFAAVGDAVILEAYQGKWYSRAVYGAVLS